jgi:hypothetical protein
MKRKMKQADSSAFYQEPTRDEISLCAYLAWEKDGRPSGHSDAYWAQAETLLRHQRRAAAEVAAAKAKRQWPPARIVTTAPAKLKKLTTSVRKVAAAGKAAVSRKRKTA